jgi:hypothetical protein
MAYTDIDKPSDYFNTVLYTGNGSTLNVGGLDFTQNFTWIKNRSDGTSHFLYDTIRGAGNDKDLRSNSNGAEGSGDGATHGFMSAFRSDGFTVTQGSGTASITNASGNSYASWNWKAGTSFTNDASATGIGTIDSTGSVNTTAGFSICTYTGTGSVGTIKHGLNSAPSCIITKSFSAAEDWGMYHVGIGNTSNISLNLTSAQYSANSAFWNNTNPTSSVFTVGTHPTINYNTQTMLAYCFADVKGFSKFGSYVGNGSTDGTFIYTGFKPAFFVVKPYSTSGNWYCWDSKRSPINEIDGQYLELDASGAEASTSGVVDLDFLSTGVKLRNTGGGFNGSGVSFIYMAFAENPFVTSTGVPACAR